MSGWLIHARESIIVKKNFFCTLRQAKGGRTSRPSFRQKKVTFPPPYPSSSSSSSTSFSNFTTRHEKKSSSYGKMTELGLPSPVVGVAVAERMDHGLVTRREEDGGGGGADDDATLTVSRAFPLPPPTSFSIFFRDRMCRHRTTGEMDLYFSSSSCFHLPSFLSSFPSFLLDWMSSTRYLLHKQTAETLNQGTAERERENTFFSSVFSSSSSSSFSNSGLSAS